MVDTWLISHIQAYAQTFNHNDLRFRHVASHNEFIKLYVNGLRSMNPEEWNTIKPTLDQAQQLVQPYNRLCSIPFKILVLKSEVCYLENDMPHTHADTIILPASTINRISVNTLLHELLHVFQRFYPTDCHRYYATVLGYKLVGLIDHSKARSNPDINNLQYEGFNNSYASDALSIHDIIDKKDHPNEVFAYEVSTLIEHNKLSNSLISLLHGK